METKIETALRVAAVGDIGLIGRIAEDIREKGSAFPFAFVKPIFDDAEIVFGNLEIPFAEKGMSPYFREIPSKLRAAPEGAAALQHAGFDIVSLANNHVMDYGLKGLNLTIKLLNEHGIRHVGAGANLDEARQPVILTKNGFRIGFVAYAQKGAHSAGSASPGAAPIDKDLIAEDIDLLAQRVDWMVVSLHFGMIYTDFPRLEDQILARSIIDHGATVLLGHHPHVLQGIEEYNGRAIAYSLGEFIFDPTRGNILASHVKKIRRQSIIAKIILRNASSEIKPIAVLAGEDYRPQICTGLMQDSILHRLFRISKPLPEHDFDFYSEVASRTVNHNIRVILFHLKKLNWRYVLGRLSRIRLYHLKILLGYFRNITSK